MIYVSLWHTQLICWKENTQTKTDQAINCWSTKRSCSRSLQIKRPLHRSFHVSQHVLQIHKLCTNVPRRNKRNGRLVEMSCSDKQSFSWGQSMTALPVWCVHTTTDACFHVLFYIDKSTCCSSTSSHFLLSDTPQLWGVWERNEASRGIQVSAGGI